MKRAFTLIELFVCISILAVSSSVMLFRSGSMVRHYFLQRNVNRLAKELECCRKISLNLGGEIDFLIEKRGQTLYCRRETDESPNFNARGHRFQIEGISRLLFEGVDRECLNVAFERTGVILPVGKIVLVSDKKAYQVVLNGSKNQRILAKEVSNLSD